MKKTAVSLYLIALTGSVFAASSATRTISPTAYTPGSTVTVTITAILDSTVLAHAIEEIPPTNWTVISLSTDGVVSDPSGIRPALPPPASGIIKWGIFITTYSTWGVLTDTGSARSSIYPKTSPTSTLTFRYLAVPPAGETGNKSFSGKISTDGATIPIGGVGSMARAPVHPADSGQNFVMDATDFSAALFCYQHNSCSWGIPATSVAPYFSNALFMYTRNAKKYHYDDSTQTTAPNYWMSGQ